MRIPLDRPFIVELYCYSFQAERSIHYALGAEWQELREYYRGDRLAGVRSVGVRLKELLLRHGIPPPEVGAEDRNCLPDWANPIQELVGCLFRALVGKWLARWQKFWSFSDRELGFMSSTMNTLVHVLDSPTRPEQNRLINLRMDLCACRSTIEFRCYGIAEIEQARWLEHFWQADWITPVRLTDILGKQHHKDRSTRQSA